MKQSGTTLLELMVVLAVSAILLTIAIPGFASLASNSRLTSATNELVSALHLARSEAIKRNSRTTLCKSTNGLACSDSGGWHQGWMVFHDANSNATLDAGEEVILYQAALTAEIRLAGNEPVSQYVSYSSIGATQMVSGAFQAGTFTVCQHSSVENAGRKIIISSTGRVRTTKAVLASCF